MIEIRHITQEKRTVYCCVLLEADLDQDEKLETILFNDNIKFLNRSEYFIFSQSSSRATCSYCWNYVKQFEWRRIDNYVLIWDEENIYLDQEIIYMNTERYTELKTILQQVDDTYSLPDFKKIAPLSSKDVAHIFWDEMPEAIQGYKPFLLKKQGYLNTDAPEKELILSIIKNLLEQYATADKPVQLEKVSDENLITIILDTPDYFEWKPLAKTKDGYALMLNEFFCLALPKDTTRLLKR